MSLARTSNPSFTDAQAQQSYRLPEQRGLETLPSGASKIGRWRDAQRAFEECDEGADAIIAHVQRHGRDGAPLGKHLKRPHQAGSLAPSCVREARLDDETAAQRPFRDTCPLRPFLDVASVTRIVEQSTRDEDKAWIAGHRRSKGFDRSRPQLIQNDLRKARLLRSEVVPLSV